MEMFGDINLDENWSEIEQICGSDSLCYVQQVADYCHNSATKIQELEADNLCNETDQRAAGQMMKMRFKKVVDEKDIEKAFVSRVKKNTFEKHKQGNASFFSSGVKKEA